MQSVASQSQESLPVLDRAGAWLPSEASSGFRVTFMDAAAAAPWRLSCDEPATFFVYSYKTGDTVGPAASLQIMRNPANVNGCGRSIVCSLRSDWLADLMPPGLETGTLAGLYYLTPHLYSIAAAAFDIAGDRAAFRLYRSAKAQELVCETLDCWLEGELTPQFPKTTLSLVDFRRLMQARTMIEDSYREKLTLGSIGRACGLNRAKLTGGFRELFKCTVLELLSERRLAWAAEQLRLTQRQIAVIGYEAGYNNKSSFSRAFSRRFGLSPSDYRAAPVEA